MRVLAVIVNFRTPELTLRAARALLDQLAELPGSQLVVVENDSRDGSLEVLEAGLAAEVAAGRVEVVPSGHNGGFGFGVNVAVRRALAADDLPESIYLLNSDATPGPGALGRLLAFQDAHPRAAIVGSFIHGPDGEPHETAFRFPTWRGELASNLKLGVLEPWVGEYLIALPIPTTPCRVDWLAGASMLLRREVFERAGLFDEGFFLYYEETDLCRRAAAEGLETWYVPESAVAHLGGESTGIKDTRRRRPAYWYRSRRRYYLRHHGAGYLLGVNLVWVASFLLWRLRRKLRGMPDPDPPGLLGDFVRHSFVPLRETGPSIESSGRRLHGPDGPLPIGPDTACGRSPGDFA